ncbi:MAG: hypothetical protein Q8M18_09265 [Bradyrhizobium sp.]|nr:hypothetical protein [Bradyrhizobium sp.]
MTIFINIQPATILTMQRRAVVLLARLRRALNGWVAATIAHRERQASSFAVRQLDGGGLDNTRLYRGPIDDVVDRISKLRKRRGLKQP